MKRLAFLLMVLMFAFTTIQAQETTTKEGVPGQFETNFTVDSVGTINTSSFVVTTRGGISTSTVPLGCYYSIGSATAGDTINVLVLIQGLWDDTWATVDTLTASTIIATTSAALASSTTTIDLNNIPAEAYRFRITSAASCQAVDIGVINVKW